MNVRCTKTFRIAEGEGTRKYCAGEVITDKDSAKWALANGCGEKYKPEPEAKAAKAKSNKAKGAAPENKAG